uniref:Uncharacterized protein n=1 Tax=Arundo donax TaxID=35708 RepID=A0A0A8ZE20_ARUDO
MSIPTLGVGLCRCTFLMAISSVAPHGSEHFYTILLLTVLSESQLNSPIPPDTFMVY